MNAAELKRLARAVMAARYYSGPIRRTLPERIMEENARQHAIRAYEDAVRDPVRIARLCEMLEEYAGDVPADLSDSAAFNIGRNRVKEAMTADLDQPQAAPTEGQEQA